MTGPGPTGPVLHGREVRCAAPGKTMLAKAVASCTESLGRQLKNPGEPQDFFPSTVPSKEIRKVVHARQPNSKVERDILSASRRQCWLGPFLSRAWMSRPRPGGFMMEMSVWVVLVSGRKTAKSCTTYKIQLQLQRPILRMDGAWVYHGFHGTAPPRKP